MRRNRSARKRRVMTIIGRTTIVTNILFIPYRYSRFYERGKKEKEGGVTQLIDPTCPSLSPSSQSLSTAMSTTREDQEMPPPSRKPASAKGKGKASNQDDGSKPLGNKKKRLACEVCSMTSQFETIADHGVERRYVESGGLGANGGRREVVWLVKREDFSQ